MQNLSIYIWLLKKKRFMSSMINCWHSWLGHLCYDTWLTHDILDMLIYNHDIPSSQWIHMHICRLHQATIKTFLLFLFNVYHIFCLFRICATVDMLDIDEIQNCDIWNKEKWEKCETTQPETWGIILKIKLTELSIEYRQLIFK